MVYGTFMSFVGLDPIYELLKQYQGIKKRIVTIEDLRKMLGIRVDEYKLYGDFKRYVILVAYKEINEKTDISFSFREIKEVRRVHALEFTIIPKEQAKPDKMAARAKERERKQLEKEEHKKIKHREKVRAYIDRLSPEDLAELTGEARDRARKERGKHLKGEPTKAQVDGYLFELAEARMKK